MLEAMKRLQQMKIEDGDENFIYPLMKWASSDERNIDIVNFINERFFYCDKRILVKCLSLGLKYRGYMKYPKPNKFDNEKFNIIVNLLKRKYFLSNSDIESARKVIINMINDKNELEKLANDFGLDNKERKKLGLKSLKFEKKIKEKKKTKSLLDF